MCVGVVGLFQSYVGMVWGRVWGLVCRKSSYFFASPHADTLSVFFRTGLQTVR